MGRSRCSLSRPPNPGDASQIRLSYASGPMSMAIALEDSDVDGNSGDLAVAGEIAYSGDAFSGEISGIYWQNDNDNGYAYYGDGWQVGVGGSAALGDVLSLSVAAAIGENSYTGGYWLISGLASAQMTDQVHAEIGASYLAYTDGSSGSWGPYSGSDSVLEALAGIYYEPVSQLTFGLEGEYTNLADASYYNADLYTNGDGFWTFDFVSVWRF